LIKVDLLSLSYSQRIIAVEVAREIDAPTDIS
jgi:hypothetical protein